MSAKRKSSIGIGRTSVELLSAATSVIERLFVSVATVKTHLVHALTGVGPPEQG